MKIDSSIARRPIFWFIIALGILVLNPISAIFSYKIMVRQVESNMEFASGSLHKKILSDVQKSAGFPLHSSTANLAKILHTTSNATQLSFSNITKIVAPELFVVFSVLPISQISYMQADGLFFSYYTIKNQTFASFSNTSFIGKPSNISTWYTQLVDENTGLLIGEMKSGNSEKSFVNSSWFRKAMNGTKEHGLLGKGWNKNGESLFLSVASTNGGLVSLGLSVKGFANAIQSINTFDETLFLATSNGLLLAHTGPLNASMTINEDRVSLTFTRVNDVLISENAVDISCQLNNNLSRASDVEIADEKYLFYCAPIDIFGTKSVSVLIFPRNGLLRTIHKYNYLPSLLWVLSFIFTVICIGFFVILKVKTSRREMILCSTLIRQMEATQQAERKSMHKTLAFANANHDIRGAISTIIALVQLCLNDVPHGTDMHNYLLQMNVCSADLLELLNSVLDATKIEAGKMQLHEDVFNLADVIEEAVNFIYPKGVKKGLDVILDPCDGSVLRSSLVKGDRVKLKQILNNLLSNAVKFTSDGHIIVRAWARKPSKETSMILPSKNSSIWRSMLQLVYRNNIEDYNNVLNQDEDSLEVVFEVIDTGKGIPKEKQHSVFENFVQVKETDMEQGGTGLGLGIVQSLVRLMGGDIRIINKEIGEKGTCFSFNIFVSTIENTSDYSKTHRGTIASIFNQPYGLNSRTQSPILGGSQVLLLLQDYERTKIIKNFIHSLGVQVSSLNRLDNIRRTLQKVKHKFFYLNYSLSSSGKSEFGSYIDKLSNSGSHKSNTRMGRTSSRSSLSPFILIIVDDSLERLPEVCSILSTFQREVPNNFRCKFVQLVSSSLVKNEMVIYRNRLLSICDHSIRKPFHGSCLFEVLRLLPEFGGVISEGLNESRSVKEELKPQCSSPKLLQQVSSESGNFGNEKLLNGKKVLVVEDDFASRKIAESILLRFGACTEVCEDGEEAVNKVYQSLQESEEMIQEEGASRALPYDYIFMDGQMTKTDGYEATRRIRILERKYNVYIPIIAFTADDSPEEKAKEAGMDFYITKPLNQNKILEVIRFIEGKSKKKRQGLLKNS